LLKASNNTGVKPYWPSLIAGCLKGGRIETIIFSGGVGGGGGGASAPAAVAASGSGSAAAAPAEKKKEEKPKEEEVDALDGGMDMFGGGSAGKSGDY
jgi:ribosomal protein L12E/L44/L45/RPP1/RPP2